MENTPAIDANVSLFVEDDDIPLPAGFDEAYLHKIITFIFARVKRPENCAPSQEIQLSLVVTNDDNIQKLNKEYRGKDKPTNVLSFSLLDDETYLPPPDVLFFLGDVIMSHDTVVREAREQNKELFHHYTHMCVHGCLHLLGFDHEEDAEAETMETLEIDILKALQIPNPYAEEWI